MAAAVFPISRDGPVKLRYWPCRIRTDAMAQKRKGGSKEAVIWDRTDISSECFTGAYVVYHVPAAAVLIALFFCGSAQVRAAEETAERPTRAAQCFLEVNGVHYLGGDCLFTPLDKIGSFRIVGNGLSKDLSAQVKVKAAPEGEGYASWSGPQGGTRQPFPWATPTTTSEAVGIITSRRRKHTCARGTRANGFTSVRCQSNRAGASPGASAQGCMRRSAPAPVSIPSMPA